MSRPSLRDRWVRGTASRTMPGAGWALLAAVAAVSMWGAVASPYFFTTANIFNTNLNLVSLGFMAFALAPVIVAGEIDVSVQGMLTLGATTAGLLFSHHWPVLLVALTIVAVGVAGGSVNAWLVTRLGLPSLVVTLGTLILFNGLAAAELGQNDASTYPTGLYNWANGSAVVQFLPNLTVVLLILVGVEVLVLHRTALGRRLFFIGKNRDAASHSGVSVRSLKSLTFVYASVVSALAGALLAIQVSSATADSGSDILVAALTAALLARLDVAGGKGNVLAILAAVYLLALLSDVQTLIGWGPQVDQITVGVLLVGSAAIHGDLVANVMRRRLGTDPSEAVSRGSSEGVDVVGEAASR